MALAVSASSEARAFDVKHTSGGLPVHWSTADVAYVLDPSLEQAFPGSVEALRAAVASWSGAGGAPSLSVSLAPSASKPGYDGKNTVYYVADGSKQAGSALAVTVLSYDDTTGDIVDADIVINGRYDFAVLDSSSTADPSAAGVSNEGSGGSASESAGSSEESEHVARAKFDLVHVLAHETGHTLGMADEKADEGALMFASSKPGDASHRAPTTDDVAGVQDLYASSGASATPSGCSHAMVAPKGPAAGARDVGLLALLGAMTLLSARRLRAVQVRR